MKGISAIIATILLLVMTIGLASLAYTYFRGAILSTTSKLIEVTGGSCDAEITPGFYVVVKNMDPVNDIEASKELSVFIDGKIATNISWSPTETITHGGGVVRGEINERGGTEGTSHTIRVTGPSNEDTVTVTCE
jgi:flagellin-like protein